MDPTKNRTIQKLLFPGFVAVLININKILSIKTAQEATNMMIRLIVITSIIFLAIKIFPRIFNHLTQK